MAEPIRWDGWEKMQGRLDGLARAYPDVVSRSAAAIGVAVLHDAINEVPTVPYRTGKLRSSGTFEVFGGAHWRRCKLQVGFNTTYAARVHQIPMRFRESSAGNYYLSSKLTRHRQEYIRSWAAAVSRHLGMI